MIVKNRTLITQIARREMIECEVDGSVDIRYLGDCPEFGHAYKVEGKEYGISMTMEELKHAAKFAGVELNFI